MTEELKPLVIDRMPPDCAPKGVPVLVAGGVAMKKTGGEWFSGMEEPPFTRQLQWQPTWWVPIPAQNDPPFDDFLRAPDPRLDEAEKDLGEAMSVIARFCDALDRADADIGGESPKCVFDNAIGPWLDRLRKARPHLDPYDPKTDAFRRRVNQGEESA